MSYSAVVAPQPLGREGVRVADGAVVRRVGGVVRPAVVGGAASATAAPVAGAAKPRSGRSSTSRSGEAPERRARRRPRACRPRRPPRCGRSGTASRPPSAVSVSAAVSTAASQIMPAAVALGVEIVRRCAGSAASRGRRARPPRCRAPTRLATLSGLLVSSRTAPTPSRRSIVAATAKSRSSGSKPRRRLASTVSNPWSCSA